MIVLHPYPGFTLKNWLHFQELIKCLNGIGLKPILIGLETDKPDYTDCVDLRGKMTLPQTAYLIKKYNLFVGVDSGPAHLADKQNIPSVIICSGCNDPKLWYSGLDTKLIYKSVECAPCDKKKCLNPKCMDIEVGEVFAEVFKKFCGIPDSEAAESLD